MPELPEVEHLRRTLERVLPGRRVAAATLHRRDVCEWERPLRGAARDRALLLGGTFAAPLRHGKQLALVVADGRVLRVHLGMTGQLVMRTGKVLKDHVHATWTLDDGSVLTFRDPRRFGGLAPFPDQSSLRVTWARLGPDALSISPEELAGALGRTTRAVKAVLLDQGVLAGVGNIYADESLFKARIHPRRPAHRLTSTEVARLTDSIHDTLRRAIEGGGSTLRDYLDGDGRAGDFQNAHLVYGRAGEACGACGQTLRGITLAQRTTVLCARCQPLYPRRNPRRSSGFPQTRVNENRLIKASGVRYGGASVLVGSSCT